MTLTRFIKENKEQIDEYIAAALNCNVEDIPHKNNDEREMWINNDEGLYNWALSEEVDV